MSARSRLQRAFDRAVLYRLCATALGYPAPGHLAEVTRLAHAAQGAQGPLVSRLAALASAAASAHESQVGAEYVLLFDGAARCAPYEGAYGPPQMAGKAAQLADIAGFYRAFGLESTGVQPDVEDHIAAELEFMSALALKEAWAVAEGHHEHADVSREASAAFLNDHLGRWAPAFAERLNDVSQVDYYRAVTGVLQPWIVADAEALGVVLPPLAPAGADADEHEPFTCPVED
jgi:DMSO reductase family type II enzyme chaperone